MIAELIDFMVEWVAPAVLFFLIGGWAYHRLGFERAKEEAGHTIRAVNGDLERSVVRVHNLETRVASEQSRASTLEVSCEQATDHSSRLEEALETSNQKLHSLHSRLKGSEQQLEEQARHAEQLQLNVEELEPLADRLAEREQSLLAATHQLDRMKADSNREVGALTERLAVLEPANTALEGAQTRLAELEHALQTKEVIELELQENVSAFQTEIEDLRGETATLEEVREAVVSNEQDLVDRDQTISELEARLLDLEPAIAEIETFQDKLAQIEDQHQNTVEEKDEAIGTLEERLLTAESTAEDRDGAVASLRSRLSELEPLQELQSQLESARKRVSDLESTVTDNREAARKLETDLHEAQHELTLRAENSDEMQQSLTRLEPLTAEVKLWQERFEEAEQQNRELLEQRTDEISDLNTRLAELEPLESSVADLEAARGRVDKLLADLEAEQHESEKLRRQIAELEPIASQAQDHDERLRAVVAEHGTTMEARDVEIELLRERVHELEPSIQHKDAEISHLQATVDHLTPVQENADQANKELVRTTERADLLEQTLAESREREAALSGELASAGKKLGRRDRAIARLEEQVQDLGPAKTRVKQQSRNLRRQQSLFESDLDDRDATIDRFRNQVKKLERVIEKRGVDSAETPEKSKPAATAKKKVASKKPAKKKAKPKKAKRDELQQLHGIGPALEERLHTAGFHRFEQIAGWATTDLESVAEKVGTTVGRIKKDRWVANAKKLAK